MGIEWRECFVCGQQVVVKADGTIGGHNLPGWTKGSAKRALSTPIKCPGNFALDKVLTERGGS